jgi:hypothetical protein
MEPVRGLRRHPGATESDDADGAAAVGVPPRSVAHVEDVPAVSFRGEPVLGLLQLRLGNHDLQSLPKRTS